MSNPARTGVIVLGMHRSGTSLASHLLAVLGCSHGGELLEPRHDNPAGYWEHAGIIDVHNDFLAAMGRLWEDPRPWTEEDFHTPQAQEAKDRIAAVFAEDFGAEDRWALKDPRLCRLLPLWSDVLAGSGHEVFFLHVLRDPYAVASSLAQRDEIDRPSALVLWLRHVLEGERSTRGRRRAWLEFEDLVSFPAGCMEKACARLGVADRFDFAAAARALEKVPAPSHVHHRSAEYSDPELARRYPWIDRVQRALHRLARQEEELARAELDQVAEEIAEAEGHLLYHAAASLLGEKRARYARDLEQVVKELEPYVRKLEKEVADKNGELDRVGRWAHDLNRTVAEQRREIERLSQAAAGEAES